LQKNFNTSQNKLHRARIPQKCAESGIFLRVTLYQTISKNQEIHTQYYPQICEFSWRVQPGAAAVFRPQLSAQPGRNKDARLNAGRLKP